jgi:hypothetical protein
MNPNLETVSIKNLKFDPDNPRLPEKYKHKPDDDVLRYMLLECNLIELMMSIGEKGYFSGEPLMVVSVGENSDLVVEGNRRLGALKLLQEDTEAPVFGTQVIQARQSAKHRPTQVPVLRFSKREDILTYLGYRHITGIKEWDALAKARYVYQLRALHSGTHSEAHKALAKEIGSKAAHVAKLLTGYTLVKKANELGILTKLKLEEDDIAFSLLTTGIGWENISHFIGLEGAGDVEAKDLKPDEFEEFFRWVFDKTLRGFTVLGESRNFNKLARVVANESALASLRRGDPLDTADLLTSGPLEAVRKHMTLAESSVRSAQETLAVADGLTTQDAGQAERLRKNAIGLHSSIKGLVEATQDAED